MPAENKKESKKASAGNVLKKHSARQRLSSLEEKVAAGHDALTRNENAAEEKKRQARAEMKQDIQSWGAILILIGIISIALAAILQPIWGIMLIVTGILSLFYQQRFMFLIIGAALLLAGVMNFLAGLEGNPGPVFLSLLQGYWGVQELLKFKKYSLIGGAK